MICLISINIIIIIIFPGIWNGQLCAVKKLNINSREYSNFKQDMLNDFLKEIKILMYFPEEFIVFFHLFTLLFSSLLFSSLLLSYRTILFQYTITVELCIRMYYYYWVCALI